MALESTQPLTSVFPGGKSGRCVRLTILPPFCAVVIKSGNLKFLEPSGPLQACNGTALPLPSPLPLLIYLRMSNVPRRRCRGNQNTLSITFSKSRAIYEIRWKNPVEPDRPQMTIWGVFIACWITKAADTHSEYVILFILIALILQQRLHERASMLRYTCNGSPCISF